MTAHLMSHDPSPSSASLPQAPDWLNIVHRKVEDLRFGVVQIVIHDGKVTQLERTEKTRLGSSRGD